MKGESKEGLRMGRGEAEPPSSRSGSRELQCVGKMEIETPKPAGFLCGSIPVFPDYAINTALLPSSRLRVSAPRYRVLPTSTDLNRPPVFSEKMLPPAALLSQSFPGPPGALFCLCPRPLLRRFSMMLRSRNTYFFFSYYCLMQREK